MYQDRDYEVIDYHLFGLPKTHYKIRGPGPSRLDRNSYFSCIGAAQTFGCFCEDPYPTLIARSAGLPALNLGFAGAGPRFFLLDRTLIDYVNQGQFAIVQVMSARSEDNSLFDTGGLEYLTRRSDNRRLGAEPAYRELLATAGPDRTAEIIEETRTNWINSYLALFEAFQVPAILLWFSRRSPDYEENYSDVWGLFGEFPQFVNRAMVERIREGVDAYVECISSRGSPQPLVSRFTGEPVFIENRPDLGGGWDSVNPYYPSPEMHHDAADSLSATAQEFARSGQ